MLYFMKYSKHKGRKPGSKNKTQRITSVQLQQLVAAYNDGKSTTALAAPLGVNASTVSRWLKDAGVVVRTPGFGRGEDHPCWVGGEHTDPQGYVLVWVPKEDPLFCMARKGHEGGGYVPKHRLVMAKKLGRPLTEEETVHHKDGDHGNNRGKNLQLRRGRHGKGVALRCADCGSHNIKPISLAEKIH